MRWENEAKSCATARGYTVIEVDGVTDYQGWGSLLLHNSTTNQWAILSWSYGSCSGCDRYEDIAYGWGSDNELQAERDKAMDIAMSENIQLAASEEDARLKYSASKGW